MAKLDRLGWAAGIAFISHGLRIGIRLSSTDHDAVERLTEYLPPGWKPARSPVVEFLYSLRIGGTGPRPGIRHFHLVYSGPQKLVRTMDMDEALAALEYDLSLLVAHLTPRRVFVHAGVVGWRGQAILIPGPSQSGTTSLVAALVRAGATYYSDEFAVLDAHGRVHPYPKPLSIRLGPEERIERRSVAALGGIAGVKPQPVGLVAITEYKAGTRWRPRPLSAGESVLALLANTIPARRRPAVVLDTLERVVSTATTLRGMRGEAEQTVDPLLAVFAS
jgi:hypothetical protein